MVAPSVLTKPLSVAQVVVVVDLVVDVEAVVSPFYTLRYVNTDWR